MDDSSVNFRTLEIHQKWQKFGCSLLSHDGFIKEVNELGHTLNQLYNINRYLNIYIILNKLILGNLCIEKPRLPKTNFGTDLREPFRYSNTSTYLSNKMKTSIFSLIHLMTRVSC